MNKKNIVKFLVNRALKHLYLEQEFGQNQICIYINCWTDLDLDFIKSELEQAFKVHGLNASLGKHGDLHLSLR